MGVQQVKAASIGDQLSIFNLILTGIQEFIMQVT